MHCANKQTALRSQHDKKRRGFLNTRSKDDQSDVIIRERCRLVPNNCNIGSMPYIPYSQFRNLYSLATKSIYPKNGSWTQMNADIR